MAWFNISISAEFILPQSFQGFMLVKFWTMFFLITTPYMVHKIKEHGQSTQTARQQQGLQVTPKLWLLSMELASCHPSGTMKLDIARWHL